MSTPEGGSESRSYESYESYESSAPDDLAQRLHEARGTTAELMERLLASAQSSGITVETRPGTEMLLFWCRGVPCALPLTALREVLPEPPKAVYLPSSPAWMLGIFPLRNELVGLVDPAPLLFGPNAPAAEAVGWSGAAAPAASLAGLPGARPPAAALIVGAEDRCLAWMVDMVGEIANAQDEEISPGSETSSAAGAIAPRYVAGLYRDAAAERECVVLRAEALLDDLLAALEEGGAGAGEVGKEARRG